MAEVDPRNLSVVELKSLILDEQDKSELAGRNAQILRAELQGRTKVTNMVENAEKVNGVEEKPVAPEKPVEPEKPISEEPKQ